MNRRRWFREDYERLGNHVFDDHDDDRRLVSQQCDECVAIFEAAEARAEQADR